MNEYIAEVYNGLEEFQRDSEIKVNERWHVHTWQPVFNGAMLIYVLWERMALHSIA